MKMILSILFVTFFFQGCIAQSSIKKEVYSWISSESIPRDSFGRVIGRPAWTSHWQMESPYDTFVVYKNCDSIRMIALGGPGGKLFKKVQIHSEKWKPKLEYGNDLYLMGTYEREGLPGMYFSFYATKDWSSLMQILYSNPGNITQALVFSKNSINRLQQKGILIDPKEEQSEPESAQIRLK